MDDLGDYERSFRRAGLPLLIEDYSAREDVFTRAVPLLGLVFIVEVLGAIKLSWPLEANIAAVTGGLAIVLGAFAALNRARGRPALARPDDIGPAELATFVLVPALLPLIFGFQPVSAVVTAAGNALLLLVVYVVVGFGVLSIVSWAAARLLSQLAASLLLLARALPLLLIFSVVLFLTTEMWQVFGGVSYQALIAIGLLFVGFGTIFLVARLPREVGELEREASEGGPPLSQAQRVNVGLVLFVSQALQVLVVSLAIALFFVLFGLLAIKPEVRDGWLGSHANPIVEFKALGERVELSWELLRVSGAIAAFSGLYYAIAVLTDSTYREEFLEELTGQMRVTFRQRAEYLKLRAASRAA
ncbi:MAG: hypothetical protein QOK04_769 [Solirubrobacteraceae bacterium]|jgi:hypothetical protein|nr:hypothetical protein [Solirubrobacteraceae bacterium]